MVLLRPAAAGKVRSCAFLFILAFSCCLFAAEVWGGQAATEEEVPQNANPSTPLVISRIHGPVTLDGLSNEPAWDGIEPVPLMMMTPNHGDEPTERTEILFGYDDDYLYVAGRLYDSEPFKIQAPSKKRDQTGFTNDWLGVVLDSFNDKENALFFNTTPSGLRTDIAIFNDAQGRLPFNVSWNTFWDVETVVNDEGWFAEMRIPVSSLRFQSQDGRVVMGLIALRNIARKAELDIFPRVELKHGTWSAFKPSQSRQILFEDLQSRKPLYVTPYLLGGAERSFNLNDTESAYLYSDDPTFEAGLDVKYGMTSNLTLDLTLNTDFAQVEADDQQINLTRFSLFFPEKRMFFQERSSVFNMDFGDDNRLFYSRRIGIHEGAPVRIYGGGRVVGRVGPWDLGMINMQTAPVAGLPSENFGVFRTRRQVINPYSYVGGMITSRIGVDGTYNTAYGVDSIFRLFGDDYLAVKWAQTFETGLENKPVSLEPARVYVNWERRSIQGLGYNLTYSRAGSQYNPGIGFELRDDFTLFRNRLQYGWVPGEESRIFRRELAVDGFVALRNADREVESAAIGPELLAYMKSDTRFELSPKVFYENVPETFSLSDDAEVPAGKYTFYGLSGRWRTPRSELYYLDTRFEMGSFYDGYKLSFGVSPTWNVSSSLELSGSYKYNWISFPARNQKFITSLVSLKGLVMFSTQLSTSAFIQYNSAYNVIVANIRFRYNPREGNDLYVVYNEGLNTGLFREVPVLPRTNNRTLLLKYTYTFGL